MNLLGFGNTSTTPIQPQSNNQFGGTDLLGGSLLGFGGPSKPHVPVQNTGFNMQPNQVNQNQGFNWGTQPVAQTQQAQVYTVVAYENQHIQIVMKCIKESNDTTKITAHYTNKTQSLIENLSIAAAVMKHLKLTLNPLNSTTLQPMSRDVVSQVIFSLTLILFRQ